MAYREIVKEGDSILRKKSKEVKIFDDKLEELLDDMASTMLKYNGVGIAGPQVGVLKRVVIVNINNLFLELVNPEIINQQGQTIEKEGCLSVPNVTGKVKRPKQVTVKAQDRYGNNFTITGENWLARCLCHEIDHLNGILFIDKMIKEEKKDNNKENKYCNNKDS